MRGILNFCRPMAAPWVLSLLLMLLASAVPSAVLGVDGAAGGPPPGWMPAPRGYPPPPAPGLPPMVGPQYPGADRAPAWLPPIAPPGPVMTAPQPQPGSASTQDAPAPAGAPTVQSQPVQPQPVQPQPVQPDLAQPDLAQPQPVSAPPRAVPPTAPVAAEPPPAGAFPDVESTGASADTASSAAADAGARVDATGLTSGDSPACMRCHWMETLAYRDPQTREIVNLSIDREAYEHSVHHELACGDCHDRGYKHYPHRTTSADEGLQCVECHAQHQDDPDHQPPKLEGFDAQFRSSVHAKLEEEPLNCFSCHNPHAFKPLPTDTPVPEVVAANNKLCLDCHTELRSPVPKGHDWLPRPQQHWGSVRCIDCHTPVDGRGLYAPSHELLGADDSNQNCVECHSKGGQLLAQLYVHRAGQEREEKGLFAHAIYNDAYIIGMSRSPLIDLIGLAVVGLLIIGIGAHGYGRYSAYKRLTNSGAESGAQPHKQEAQ